MENSEVKSYIEKCKLENELYNVKMDNSKLKKCLDKANSDVLLIQKLKELVLGYRKISQSKDATIKELTQEIEEAKLANVEVYGVELQGNIDGTINIDHHAYGEDDRRNPKSSLEQVADVIGTTLTVEEQFIAANDKGYIPAMIKLGEELGIEKTDLEHIIQNVRMKDRNAQGVTLEQEEEARAAIEALGNIDNKRQIIIELPHSKTSTICDRLYGKYDDLLIISADGETNFFGQTKIIDKLDQKFKGGWKGGQLEQGSGFWGGYADQKAIRKLVEKEYGLDDIEH